MLQFLGPIANLAGTWLENKVEKTKADGQAKVAEAKARATVAEKVDTYDIYNVCYGEGYTVMEVLELIKEIEGNDNPIEFVNNKAPMIPKRLLSNEKIKKLGWKPKYDLRSGLENAINWYKEHKHEYDPNSKP